MPVPITPARWHVVRRIFRDGFASQFHFAIASVGADGAPRITPIGSVALTGEGRGYYFEEYAAGLRRDLERDRRVCVMAVNSSRWELLKALLLGRVTRPFGVRLYGTAGERRPATPEEQARFSRRVSRFRLLRGHALLWGKLRTVRELRFDALEPVRIPPLGEAWPEAAEASTPSA